MEDCEQNNEGEVAHLMEERWFNNGRGIAQKGMKGEIGDTWLNNGGYLAK